MSIAAIKMFPDVSCADCLLFVSAHLVSLRIRKERKVRPGFTPVEDVARYRPAKAREAEEARKRGVPGSAVQTTASTARSSTPTAAYSSPRTPLSGKSASDQSAWRSSSATPSAATDGRNGSAQPRGKFAPLEPARQPRDRRSAAATSIVTSELPSSGAKPWQNSRLRKPQQSQQSQPSTASTEASTAVPEAWDQDQAEQDGKPVSKGSQSTPDDLATQLDSLRIGKIKDDKDDKDDKS